MPKKLLFLSILTLFFSLGAGCVSFGGKTAAGPMGMFKSTDKGESWKQANVLPTPAGLQSLSSVRVYRVATDPTDPNAFYLGTRGQGLFYTYNKGVSWQESEVMRGRFIYGLAVDPQNKCTVFVSDGANIFRTNDCLRTWKTVYTEQRGQRVVSIAVDYKDHNTVLAALFGGEILKSVNAGDSWRPVKNFNSNLQYIAADPLTPGRFYVASARNGLARSDDSGNTWTGASKGMENYSDSFNFFRLVLHPNQKDAIFWLSKYGILYSTDAGNSWTDLKLLTPPGSVNIYTFAVSPKNSKEMYYVGTVFGEKGASRSTFYKSVDGGRNWVTRKLPTNTVPITLNINLLDDNLLFMGYTIPDQE